MQEDRDLYIKITAREMRAEIQRVISSPHSGLISDVILGWFKDDAALTELWKALHGVEEVIDFKPGDAVWIKRGNVYISNISDEKTIKGGMLFQGFLRGTVKFVRTHSTHTLHIAIQAMDTQGRIIDYETYASHKDIYPADSLKLLPDKPQEASPPQTDDTLPF